MELAQNAVDAAARAGVPARLRLALAGGVLTAENTGAPLDAEGVEALATLRASGKRDDASVGRFGVGFAAVLAVTDSPALTSRRPDGTSWGVRWSRADTRELVRGVPALAAELKRRSGHVPVLRLPFPDDAPPPAGWTTQVRLPLRDDGAEALTRRLLAEVDASLPLVLPGLVELVVEVDGTTRRILARRHGDDLVVDDDGVLTRWRTAAARGTVPAELLADRGVEERGRTGWGVTWAVPVDGAGRRLPVPREVAAVVRAPTPTDDALGMPAVLVATFPLDPTRRRVAPGALTEWLCVRAGEVLADLAAALAAEPGVLALVPTGFAAGSLDVLLRAAAVDALRAAPLLPSAEDPAVRLRGRDAAVLDGATPALVERLAEAVPGLLPAAWAAESASSRLAALGVRRVGLAAAVDALAGLARPPDWWGGLYAALGRALASGDLRSADHEALGALPVPLADGRLAPGPRGVLVPVGGALASLGPDDVRALGLRVVDPAAADPLLVRLGAVEAGPAALLADPGTRAAVAASVDDADAGEDVAALADAVLRLVAASGRTVADEPWLADLALADDDGEPAPAGELLLPGSPLADLVDPDGPLRPVAPDLLDRHGAEALAAVGVLATFAVARVDDAVLDGAAADRTVGLDVDGEAEWVEAVTARAGAGSDLPPPAVAVTAVRDLELVRDDAWPQALALLAEPGLREHVVAPLALTLPDGRRAAVPSYTAWWLSEHPVVGGRRPVDLRLPDAERALVGLYDAAPAGVDPDLLRAAGARATLAEVLATAEGAAELLARLADPARGIGRADLRAVYAALPGAFADADLVGLPWPERLRAVRGGRVEVVDVDDVLVGERPDLLGLLGRRGVLPVALEAAEALAWTLDVERASEVASYDVVSRPHRTLAWADVPGVDLAVRRLGTDRPPTAVVAVHRGLTVTDADGEDADVAWRAVADVDHVEEGDPGALGRALAWRLGAWPRRAAAGEALRAASAEDRALLEAEDDLDGLLD